MNCPFCNAENEPIGMLGNVEHFVCRYCKTYYNSRDIFLPKHFLSMGPRKKVLEKQEELEVACETFDFESRI